MRAYLVESRYFETIHHTFWRDYPSHNLWKVWNSDDQGVEKRLFCRSNLWPVWRPLLFSSHGVGGSYLWNDCARAGALWNNGEILISGYSYQKTGRVTLSTYLFLKWALYYPCHRSGYCFFFHWVHQVPPHRVPSTARWALLPVHAPQFSHGAAVSYSSDWI